MIMPEKSSNASIRPINIKIIKSTIVICIPYSECSFVRRKDVFELSQIDSEVIAYTFEATVQLTDLSETQVNEGTVSLELSSSIC